MKDNFSSQASTYAQFRPGYPAELYEFLLSLIQEKTVAWDCGCGNGQVAGVLAGYFKRVEATDISQAQLEHAIQKPNIHYQLAKSEESKLESGSVDLVTIAQAIHWFDFDAFYREVYRVAKPGSVIAAWCYGPLSIDPELDRIIQHLYSGILGKYWDSERHYIDERLQTIPFPFDELEAPEFSISVSWSLEHLLGYLNTWSAVLHFIQGTGKNPLEDLSSAFRQAWGEEERLEAKFPLFTRIGRV
jgi:SAM-dependent methyltransferase